MSSPDRQDMEKAINAMDHIEKSRTAGGHINDTAQPSLPVVHRRFANPAPLGLYSFATGIFLLSTFGLDTRGITVPNIIIGVLIFFTGIAQFLAGIMEFVAGNTFGATVFTSYSTFALSYSMIYIPGTGIMAAYGDDMAMFNKSVAIYLFAWMILTTLFTVGAIRSSAVLLGALVFFELELILLGCGFLLNSMGTLRAGYSVGYLAAFFAYWAACAGFWAGDLTPINLPVFELAKRD